MESKHYWKDEIPRIEQMIASGMNVSQIARHYSVTRQRMWQVLSKYGVPTPTRTRKSFLRELGKEKHWLDKILRTKSLDGSVRQAILESTECPTLCPMLGIELNYDGIGRESGWTRNDDSPSLDRIDSSRPYEVGNVHVISWRANRIKNDSTPTELMRIAKYMIDLTS